MTQFDFGNIDPDTTSGTDLSESILEPWRDALHSCHKGSDRPSYAGQGLMWIDDSATPWLIKVFTGSTDSIIGSIAPSTGVFNVRSDVISEASSGTGVTVDGVLLKDGTVTTDTINEETADAGVTIDGVLLKDGGGAAAMTSAGGNFPNVDADVTATDEELNSGWFIVESISPSTGDPAEFTASAISDYDTMKVVFQGARYNSGFTESLVLQFSGDGGSSYVTSSSYDYSHSSISIGASSQSVSGSSGDPSIELIPASGESDTIGTVVDGLLFIYRMPFITNVIMCSWEIVLIHETASDKVIRGAGILTASITMDAFRIKTDSDSNFTGDGSMSLYGLR